LDDEEYGTVGAKGGYSRGYVYLEEGTILYIYVGGSGNTYYNEYYGEYDYEEFTGFNGGGQRDYGYPGGGGATDIRIEDDSLYARVIVAGGGGSDGGYRGDGLIVGSLSALESKSIESTSLNLMNLRASEYNRGGVGGGLKGGKGQGINYNSTIGYGGTQTEGGISKGHYEEIEEEFADYADYIYGSYGEGGNGSNNSYAAGGGGWFGGAGTFSHPYDYASGGGGGSGWIFTEEAYNAGYTGSEYTGDDWLLGQEYFLDKAVTIPGNYPVPTYDGYGSMMGNAGDGFAKITLLEEDSNIIEIIFTYTIPDDIIENTTITNVVTVICDEDSEPREAEADIEVRIPKISIEKELAEGQRSTVIPGETVRYVITVTNEGEIELHNVVVTDSLDLTWMETIPVLPAGDGAPYSLEYEFEYTIPLETLNGATVKNTVSVVCDEITEPVEDDVDVLVYTPDLTITKELTLDQRNPVIPGEPVDYKIVVTNTGNIELNNIVVTDNLDSEWNETIDKLEPGENREYTFRYIVPNDTLNNTTITNTVSATCDEITEPIEDSADILVYVPDLTITKELASGQRNPVIPGEIVNYKITVKNTGSIEVYGVEVTDDLDSEWNETIDKLEPEESREYTFTYLVPDETVNNTTIKNTASVICEEIPNPITDDVDILVKTPGLNVSKELAEEQRNPVIPGETVKYKIVVENTGNIELTNVEITDSLDSSWIELIDVLGIEEKVEYEFIYVVPVETPNDTTIKNIVTAICDEIPEEKAEVDILVKTPGLNISKELEIGQRNPVIPGETVRYKIVVENTGDIELNNVIVTDNLDSNWIQEIPVLNVGESEEYTFTYTVPTDTVNDKIIINTAVALCDEIEEPEMDDVEITVKIPDINISKELASGQRNPVMPGETVKYKIVVENTGEIELNNVIVTDNLDSNWIQEIPVLNVGESEEYEFTYVIPTDTVNETIITNIASVVTDELPEPSEDDVEIAVRTPGLNVSKELALGQRNPVIPGETVTYKIVVENNGNIELNNVIVTDNLDLNWIHEILVLNVGESEEYEFTYVIPNNARNNETITNIVSVVSDEIPIPVEDEADILVKTPGLNISKELAEGQRNLVIPGETVKYKIVVENNGEIELTNVEITDSLDSSWIQTIDKLNPGESKEYEFTYTIPDGTSNGRIITNIVTVVCDEIEDPEEDEVDVEVKTPRISISKELAPGQRNPVIPGEIVTYIITVTNIGEIELNNLEITDDLNETWIQQIEVLNAGEVKEYTFTYTVPVDTLNETIITNIVTVVCDEIEDPEEDEVDVIVKTPDLSITKELAEGQRDPVMPGETVTYKIVIENTGNIELNNVVVKDNLDDTWIEGIPVLEIGEKVEYVFTYIIPTDTADNTIIINIASVTCEELDEPKEDETEIIVRTPGLSISKELAEGQRNPVIPGETVMFRIVVSNAGEIELTNVEITDSLDLGWFEQINVLMPRESKEYEFEYIVPEDILNNTTITNIATATCEEIPIPVEDEAEIIVRIPDLNITKELAEGQRNPVIPGETVRYKITVENIGSIEIYNVKVRDTLVEDWSQTINVLEVGEKAEYEVTYVIPLDAENNDVIKNTAVAICDEITDPVEDSEEIIVKIPSYAITKTLAPGQNKLVIPGEIVRYIITILNTGEIELTNVEVTDSLNETWIQKEGILRAGESKEYEFIYQVPIGTEYETVITNIAKIECDELDEETAETDVIVKEPILIVRKELAEGQEKIAYPGETIKYKIIIENIGNRDIHNIEVLDILDGNWIKIEDILVSGEILEYDFEYIVPMNSQKGEIITNIVMVNCDELDEITDDEEVIVNIKVPEVSIKKKIVENQVEVTQGEEVKYTITVTNTGNVDLNNVIVKDSLDEDWSQIIDILLVGEEAECEFIYIVPDGVENNEEIINVASVTSEEITEPKEDTAEIIVKVPNVSIEKELVEDQKLPILPGETVKYKIVVKNISEVDLTNVVITDSLDSSWVKTLETLLKGEEVEYEFTYTVPLNARNNEEIINIASVMSNELDEPRQAEETITVKVPSYKITKELAEDQSESVVVGEKVTYRIIVENTGEVDIHDVVITDSLDKEEIWTKRIDVLKHTEFNIAYYTFEYTVPESIEDGETITNIAKVESRELEDIQDEVDIIVSKKPIANYKIEKKLAEGQSGTVAPGTEVKYVITVTNTGSIDLTNVVVTDSLDSNWIKGLKELKRNEKIDYEFIYKVPMDTKNNETIKNIASANCDELNEIQADKDIKVRKDVKLNLVQFITQVNGRDIQNREPKVIVGNKDIKYEMSKDPVKVEYGEAVTYTIRIYNEEILSVYIAEINNILDEKLEYIPQSEINKQYRWREENGVLKTDYLSKENGEDKLLEGFDRETMDTPTYKDIKLELMVKDNNSGDIIENKAEIGKVVDVYGEELPDMTKEDSEYVVVKEFDLQLHKNLEKILVIEGGVGRPARIADRTMTKIELDRRNIEGSQLVVFYSIEVENKGEVAGYAKEIKDYIPDGMKLDPAYSNVWEDKGNNIVATKTLAHKLLQPGEKESVEIGLIILDVLSNFGDKTNIAEISMVTDKYDNQIRDISSTPDNKVMTENDLGTASVLIGIRTGIGYYLEDKVMQIIATAQIIIVVITSLWITKKRSVKFIK